MAVALKVKGQEGDLGDVGFLGLIRIHNGWTDSVKRDRVELKVKCFTEFLSVKHFTSFRFKFYS